MRKSKPCIYCIENIQNGKKYVGSSLRGLAARKYLHRRMLTEGRHHSKHLQRAWSEYGPDAFRFFVIEKVLEPSQLIAREQHWMDALKAANPAHGYNSVPRAGSNAGAAFYRTEAYLLFLRNNGLKSADRLREIASHPHTAERRMQNSIARSKLSELEVKQVRMLLAEGVHQVAIAKRYGVSDATISNIKRGRILAYGGAGGKDFVPKRHHHKITPADRAKVREMYAGGMTQTQIADKTGYSQSVVSNIVRGR